MDLAVDHEGRRAGAEAEAEDRFEADAAIWRGLLEIDPEALLDMPGQGFAADALAGFGPAQADDMAAGGVWRKS
jgi:hypothetical protein